MLISIKNSTSKEAIRKALNENNILLLGVFDNVYEAVCAEEIDMSIANYDGGADSLDFNNLSSQVQEQIKEELTSKLYNSKGAEKVFQELAEVSHELMHNEAIRIQEALSVNILSTLDSKELFDVIMAYDEYIRYNSEENEEFGSSWMPVSINEFYDNEYRL